MALGNAHNAVNHALRLDGATQAERVEETLQLRMRAVETAQDALDWYAETQTYTPDYLVAEYQDAVQALADFASYWGFDA